MRSGEGNGWNMGGAITGAGEWTEERTEGDHHSSEIPSNFMVELAPMAETVPRHVLAQQWHAHVDRCSTPDYRHVFNVFQSCKLVSPGTQWEVDFFWTAVRLRSHPNECKGEYKLKCGCAAVLRPFTKLLRTLVFICYNYFIVVSKVNRTSL